MFAAFKKTKLPIWILLKLNVKGTLIGVNNSVTRL